MRLSKTPLGTLREDPADADVPSHRLLARAGLIHKIAAGIYSYSPLMWRVIKKIKNIVREELDREGGQEILMHLHLLGVDALLSKPGTVGLEIGADRGQEARLQPQARASIGDVRSAAPSEFAQPIYQKGDV